MSFLRQWTLLLALAVGWAGCWPAPRSPLDEEKESNFITGKARVQDRDFDGAIEAFAKALEVNPHSAMAHFELAQLYDQQKNDYAAALYHYERAYRLRPNAHPGELARERIALCKIELAKTVLQSPTTEHMQREIDQLRQENQRLRDLVAKWEAYYKDRSAPMPAFTTTNAAPPPAPAPAPGPGSAMVGGRSAPQPARPDVPAASALTGSVVRAPAPAPSPPARPATRTHKVVSGETPSHIAARYGIKLSALRAANPGMDDRRLRPGQTLVIPTP